MTDKPSYYTITPANVRYDKRLSPNAIILYGEICTLCNYDRETDKLTPCFAENSYFAEIYEVTINSVKKWIKELVQNGHIKSTIIYKEGTKQVIGRHLEPTDPGIKKYTTSGKNFTDPGIKKYTTPGIKKLPYTNTRDTNTSITNSGQRRKSKSEDKKTASYDIEQYTKSALENEIVYDRTKYKPS